MGLSTTFGIDGVNVDIAQIGISYDSDRRWTLADGTELFFSAIGTFNNARYTITKRDSLGNLDSYTSANASGLPKYESVTMCINADETKAYVIFHWSTNSSSNSVQTIDIETMSLDFNNIGRVRIGPLRAILGSDGDVWYSSTSGWIQKITPSVALDAKRVQVSNLELTTCAISQSNDCYVWDYEINVLNKVTDTGIGNILAKESSDNASAILGGVGYVARDSFIFKNYIYILFATVGLVAKIAKISLASWASSSAWEITSLAGIGISDSNASSFNTDAYVDPDTDKAFGYFYENDGVKFICWRIDLQTMELLPLRWDNESLKKAIFSSDIGKNLVTANVKRFTNNHDPAGMLIGPYGPLGSE